MYKIIADSGADMNPALLAQYPVATVPFTLYVEDAEYRDDFRLDVERFVRSFTASKKTPRSSCPSPEDFLKQMEGADEYFVVTLTSKLSGTYNAAKLAERMFRESGRAGRVYVFDSKGAGPSETLLIRQIHELKRAGKTFDEVVIEVEASIAHSKVFFISESLNNLIKNGRISRWKGLLAQALNILPIMGGEDGEIKLIEKVRSFNKAYQRLIELLTREVEEGGKRFVAITHVGNLERAQEIVSKLIASTSLHIEQFFTSKAAGLTSLYADRGGIIVAL